MAYYSLNVPYEVFVSEVTQLNSIINRLATYPESLERDIHIEGGFLRLVVNWETFIEEYFLRCMCIGKTRKGGNIKPKVTSCPNINEAFKRINRYRKDREKDYIDWLDVKLVQQRINDNFRANSRVQKICEAPDQLFQLRVIRNAIAHRSVSAISKFENLVKDQMGYLAVMNPTMAALLIQKRRNSNEYIFTITSKYFLSLADRLTK